MSALLQLVEPEPISTQNSSRKITVGIDLGTTNSLVCVPGLGLVRDEFGSTLLPSIYHCKDGSMIRSIKRLMHSPKTKILVDSNEMSPIEISAHILKTLKDRAERALDEEVTQAVITVPAYFDDTARNATYSAAKLAGLDVLRLLNEPTAAALAYGLDKNVQGTYVVYDLGGGTFDVSILKLHKGVFQVIATAGDTKLGGDDIDQLLLDELPQLQNLISARKLKENLDDTISEQRFNSLIDPLISRTLVICQQAMDDAALSIHDINGVIMVGGSTRISNLVKRVGKFFQQTPLTDIDPDCTVAIGAGEQAKALTQGSDNLLLDVIPLSLGLETMGGLVERIIDRNSPIPIKKTQKFTTYKDGQTAIVFHVVQGEREFVKDCTSLGTFELKGIPPMLAGAARVEVVFNVDADGLLTVSAIETLTGISQTIEMKPSFGLTQQELISIVQNSHLHGADDLNKRLLTQSKLKAEKLYNVCLVAIKEDGELLNATLRDKIEKSLTNLQTSIASNDRDMITNAIKDLEVATEEFAKLRIRKSIKGENKHVSESN